jgi:hypothetical protein
MLVATAMPVSAAVDMPVLSDDPDMVWVNSEGAWGISKLSELRNPNADAQADCYGIAPIDTGCTLTLPSTYPFGGSWTVGWTAPATAQVAAGFLYAHTGLTMTGTYNSAVVTGGCEWAALGFPNGVIFPPFPYGVSCAFFFTGLPGGVLTATFTVSDGHAFGTPGTPGGLGTWHAILIAT